VLFTIQKKISYADLLKKFFEVHNPTQGNRQGNDVGTQYRSMILYYNDDQKELALTTKEDYGKALNKKITTEIKAFNNDFYYAEDYHQQYLHKNPNGYCGLKGTGVACPIPKKAQKSD